MDKDILSRAQAPRSGNFQDMLLESAKEAFSGRKIRKAYPAFLRILTSEAWCSLLLYPNTTSRPQKLGALVQFTTPTGQATWETIQTDGAGGRVTLPGGVRYSFRDDGGRPRWNIVLTRDLPTGGSLPEAAQVEWMIEQAQALDRAITPLISGHAA